MPAAAAPSASRVDGGMIAEAAADNAMNPDATEAEKQVTAAAEASSVLTLVQAAAAALSRVDSVMTAEALVEDAMNADATEVIATTDASSVLTLVRAAAAPSASRVGGATIEEAAADNAMNHRR